MRIAEGFLLRRIVDDWVVVPIGENSVKTRSIFSLSESSALLWEALERGCDEKRLVEILYDTYSVSEETAIKDVKVFLNNLDEMDILLRD